MLRDQPAPFAGEMRDLICDPLYRAEDLGRPIPDSAHAVSVALPLWAHNVGYEEADPAVIARMEAGYPRFFVHPRVAALFQRCAAEFGGEGDISFAFPSLAAAQACTAYVAGKAGVETRVDKLGRFDVHAVTGPPAAYAAARAYWQHAGWIISSRLADALLTGRAEDAAAGEAAQAEIRARVATLYGVPEHAVTLYPSGMAAADTAMALVRALRPGLRTAQLGFPYVDMLKVQEEFGPGAALLTEADPVPALARLQDSERFAALVTEVPSNPLLRTADVAALRACADSQDAFLVLDDTIATPVNVDLLPDADMIVHSLTKYFGGMGDALGGALVLNPARPNHGALAARLARRYANRLWGEDAVVLARRSRDMVARVQAINTNARALAERLAAHRAVARVYYPSMETRTAYDRLRREGGGYGGLLSFLPVDAARLSAPIFDRLRVSKGPNLGTSYTLACPYTILAHYGELAFAESCGVSRWLIRVSVGLEGIDDLWSRFAEALDGA